MVTEIIGRSLHSLQDTRKRVGVRCAHCRTEEPAGRRRQILWLYLTVEILSNRGLEFVDWNHKHIDTVIKIKFYALVCFYQTPILFFPRHSDHNKKINVAMSLANLRLGESIQ